MKLPTINTVSGISQLGEPVARLDAVVTADRLS